MLCSSCREPTLTPTASLLSYTTNVIMQIQAAGALGRLPCAAPVLAHVTHAKMEKLRLATGTVVESTPCVSIAELASGIALSAAAAPPVIEAFVEAAVARGDTVLLYYGAPSSTRARQTRGRACSYNTERPDLSIQDFAECFQGSVSSCRRPYVSRVGPFKQALPGKLHCAPFAQPWAFSNQPLRSLRNACRCK
jgi:hypothetical protein